VCTLQRRERELRVKGLLYVGSGVSGGEDGARYGPSLMPGGSPEAWYDQNPYSLSALTAIFPSEPELAGFIALWKWW